MISELQAVEAVLAGVASGGVHLVRNADKSPTVPYLLIEPQTANPFVEPTLVFEDGEWDVSVRVKAVGANPTSCLVVLRNARAVLTPGGRLGTLLVAGRVVDVEYVRHETDFIDTQTLLPNTTQPVSLSIDTYRLTSQPA